MLLFENASKVYDRRAVVDGVTLDVREGAVCGLIGRNGAGKTTMLRLLTGLVHPSGGSTSVAGLPSRKIQRPMRHVGVALEHFGLHPRRSGRAHLRELALAGQLPASRAEAVPAGEMIGSDPAMPIQQPAASVALGAGRQAAASRAAQRAPSQHGLYRGRLHEGRNQALAGLM